MLEHLNVAIIRLCMGISNEIKVPMIAIIKWNNDLWQHSCVMTAKKSAKKGAADSEFWVFFFYWTWIPGVHVSSILKTISSYRVPKQSEKTLVVLAPGCQVTWKPSL